jgi:hypothetical protein
MENRLSQIDLQRLYNREAKATGKHEIDKIIKSKRNTEKDPKKKNSIFLCHSHLDKTIVDRVALLFSKVDFNIYVDWMDKSLPAVTNKHTASMIRDKIKHCNRFLFLATFRALKSKWCDWELGIAYSLKRETEIALLAVESKSGKWEGSEYLQLFPEMEFNVHELENIDARKVRIKFSESQSISLEKWLNDNQ